MRKITNICVERYLTEERDEKRKRWKRRKRWIGEKSLYIIFLLVIENEEKKLNAAFSSIHIMDKM